jgi:hypothetical protein
MMTKEKILTIRWNNILTLALGIPALIYVVFALSNLIWTEMSGMIWLAAIGALY